MSDFLVVRLTGKGGLFSLTSECLGCVETRPPKTDAPDERKCLEESLWNNNEEINLDSVTRLATIVQNVKTPEDAHDIAASFFEEVMDLRLGESFGFGEVNILESGFSRNLQTGTLIPRKKKKDIMSLLKQTTCFEVQHERFPPISITQYVLGAQNIELCARYVRAAHWARHAAKEYNLQLSLLFNWFSMEALLKTSEDDNIIPKAMLALGFPQGQKLRSLDPMFIAKLENHAEYRFWKKLVGDWMEEIRKFRNDTVHSGHRVWDKTNQELLKYSFLTKAAQVCCKQLIEMGMSKGFYTAEDLWNNAELLLPQMPNIIDYVHGTLIYNLKNGNYGKFA